MKANFPTLRRKESSCDEKDHYVPEEVTPGKYFTLKKLLEILHDIERAKDELMGATPDLERNMTISARRRKDESEVT